MALSSLGHGADVSGFGVIWVLGFRESLILVIGRDCCCGNEHDAGQAPAFCVPSR